MSTLIEDDNTIMTDAHRRVLRIVESLGMRVMDEVSFPPFQADIYVPELHSAIEVDGPAHNPNKDAKRDEILLGRYGLHVLRVKSDETRERIHQLVAIFTDLTWGDAVERFEEHKDEMPWL